MLNLFNYHDFFLNLDRHFVNFKVEFSVLFLRIELVWYLITRLVAVLL